jgi:hypothetical protein
MSTHDTTTLAVDQRKESSTDDRLAHLVLKADWPTALCGATVAERFGAQAPGRDRCAECLRIAAARGLGRPGWL